MDFTRWRERPGETTRRAYGSKDANVTDTAARPGTMGDMVRRTVALVIVTLSAAGAIASCAKDDGPPAAPIASPRPSATTPPAPDATSADRAKISAVPRANARTSVAPAAGSAPAATFPVTERHLALRRGAARPLPTTVWAPAGTAPGPFPLILFSHGLIARPSDYAQVLSAWAKAGFVVAAPAYPHTATGVAKIDPLDIANQPADASYVISQVLALNTKAGDALRGRIDTARIAAAGHSAGGITTVGLFSTDRDDRLDAGVVLAGEKVLPAPFTGPAAPMLFVHGKLDRTVPYARGLAAFQAVPWSRAMLTITNGGHVTGTTGLGPVLTTTTDFLRWSLYGDRAAKARLKADATKGGAGTFIDHL
jgi:dienelactone hydrolase